MAYNTCYKAQINILKNKRIYELIVRNLDAIKCQE